MKIKSMSGLSLYVVIFIGLVGCGGGSSDGNNSSSNDKVDEPNSQPQNPTPVEPIQPKPELIELEDTATLPSLPLNNNPLAMQANYQGLDDLRSGVYDIDIGRYEDNNTMGYSCTDEKKKYCTFVKQYKLNEVSNEITTKNWMYEPTLKQWLSVEDGIPRNLFYNKYFSGDIVSLDGKWDSEYKMSLPNYLTGFEVGAGKLDFDKGRLKYEVIIEPIMLSGGAKKYNINFRLIEGEVLAIEDGNFIAAVGQSVDRNKYLTLKDYRESHTSLENFVCVPSFDRGGLVFNKNTLGAKLYAIEPFCTNKVYDLEPKTLEEGVKTIEGNKVIYLNNFTDLDNYSFKYTSELQFLKVIALDKDGIAQLGNAYQPGFAYATETKMYDRKGIYQYIDSTTDEPTALALPF